MASDKLQAFVSNVVMISFPVAIIVKFTTVYAKYHTNIIYQINYQKIIFGNIFIALIGNSLIQRGNIF
jgi:hypothetical protein